MSEIILNEVISEEDADYLVYNLLSSGNKSIQEMALGYERPVYGDFDYLKFLSSNGYAPENVNSCKLILFGVTRMPHLGYDVCAKETGEKIYSENTYFENGFQCYPIDLKRIYETTGSADFKLVADEDFGDESFLTVKTLVEVNGKEVARKALKIKVTNPPKKLIYFDGEYFDNSGMKVYVIYSNLVFDSIKDYTFADSVPLKTEQTSITLRYKGKTCVQPITVLPNYGNKATAVNSSKNYKLINGERSSKNFRLPNGIEINYNLINKSLTYVFNDIKGTDNYMGLSISHIYRPNRENEGFGKGFSLNICEKIIKENENTYYVDGAGDWYNIENGVAKNLIYTDKEPAALNKIPLYVDYRDNHNVKNPDIVKPVEWLVDGSYIRGFNKFGQLVMISDYSGNFYEFYHDSFKRIVKINCNDILDSVDTYELKYNIQGYLSEISRRGDLIEFTYEDGRLTMINNNGVKQTLEYSGEIIAGIESSDNYLSTVKSDGNADIIISTRSNIDKIPDGRESSFISAISKWQIFIGPMTEIRDIDGNSELYDIDSKVKFVKRYYCLTNSLVSYAEQYKIDDTSVPKITVYTADRKDLFKKTFRAFRFIISETTEYTETSYTEQNYPAVEIHKNYRTADGTYLDYYRTYVYSGNYLLCGYDTEYTVRNADSSQCFQHHMEFSHDENNRITQRCSFCDGDFQTEGKAVVKYIYDDKSRPVKIISYNSLEPQKAFISEYAYTELGRLESEKHDPFVNGIGYIYSDTETLPYGVSLPSGIIRQFNRDARKRAEEVVFYNSGELEKNSIDYTCDEITRFMGAGSEICYNYDEERRLSKVVVDGAVHEKISYDYKDISGNLKDVMSLTVVNANNEKVKAETDKNLTYCKMYYGDTLEAEAVFDEYGGLTKFTDGGTSEYTYNELGMLTDYKYSEDEVEKYSENTVYNIHGAVIGITQSGKVDFTYKYRYGGVMSEKLEEITISDKTVITPEYDKTGVYTGRKVKVNGAEIIAEKINYGEKNYSLQTEAGVSTLRRKSYLPSEFSYTENNVTKSIVYGYDEKGNITEINGGIGKLTEYIYDKANRLVREDNQVFDRTYIYDYDKNGNITKKSEYKYNDTTLALATQNYKYSDGKLVQINNGAYILYDKAGNPTQYNGKQLRWKGKKLTAYGNTLFGYDGRGRRISKESLIYYYDGAGRLIYDGGIRYFYDCTGAAGFKFFFDTYYYVKDVQGNIIGIVDKTGKTVAEYSYDAWGNCKIIKDTDNIATYNPYRYRGYYYDEETGLYYLQTRYYDPRTGRFLNADSVEYADPETLNGLNLYAYCGNNPVMGYDPTGTWDWGNFRDAYSTFLGFLNPISKYTAVGAIIVAACQGRGQDIKDDWNNGCFNPFNQDGNVALNSKVFSFYKGESVIRHSSNDLTSWQIFGNIFLNTSETKRPDGLDALNHEFGHGIQEKLLGPMGYIFKIAIPSVIACICNPNNFIYYSLPWERTADFFGGVNRSSGYKPNSLEWGWAENIIGPLAIPFYFIFGY